MQNNKLEKKSFEKIRLLCFCETNGGNRGMTGTALGHLPRPAKKLPSVRTQGQENSCEKFYGQEQELVGVHIRTPIRIINSLP